MMTRSAEPLALTVSPSQSLVDLPAELLHHIASYGSAESVISLQRVCKTIHDVCYTARVFRDIIANGNGLCGPFTRPYWQCPHLTLNSPVEIWARFAVADSRLSRMYESRKGSSLQDQDQIDKALDEDVGAYMPIMLALGRK